MWDIVRHLNVYLRTYLLASPGGVVLGQFSGHSIRFIARLLRGGALRAPICACSLEGALRFSSRRRSPPPSRNERSRRRRIRSLYNDQASSAWSRHSRLGPLSWTGCSRVPLRDVITAVARGKEDFRERVLLLHDRRFVQPMLHTSICTYIPGHSPGDIHSMHARRTCLQ